MTQSLLQLNSEWQPKVEESLAIKQLTRRSIAKNLNISPGSVSKFINCKPIAAHNFIRICQELNLDWGNASASEPERNDQIVSFKFKQNSFKANPGGEIAPQEIIGREKLIAQIWSILEQQSLIFIGERRIGKSSTLKKMKAESASSMVPIYRDLEGIRTPIEFVEVVWQDIETYLREQGKARRVREFLGQLQETQFTGSRFPHIADDYWKTLLIKAIEDLVTLQERQIVFIWDEIPHMLENFSEQAAMEMLDVLRSLRQTYPDVRMIFSGSIGLHHIFKNLQKAGYRNDPTNDMYTIDGQPLALEDAIALTSYLIKGENVSTFNAEKSARDIAEAVDCIPFYIHHLVNQLKTLEGEVSQNAIHFTVEESLRNPLNPWKMDHYRERIDNYYTEEQKPYALNILDLLAINPPTSFQKLWQVLYSDPQTNNKEMARTIIRLLMKDYYLVQSGSIYSFRYPLVQKYWRFSRGL
ncbi:putative ATPase (AAA+ superfamily) [Xenococcus sp. PCC 7305]|uniref:ATP-binding protein n=1 Tax=Xenococcus sp. PCC 7305 TaxID=102125 RepID=UPI0002ABB991|nr:ATP-binding protein [Xenococcus sp. PCC 7305]ELS05349.1 putative ATPase (AAA+ superfamily) [Xenococcus sp. PCC 7305]